MAKNSDPTTEDDYQAQSDADTLRRHAEITADPKRHQKAHDRLAKDSQTSQDAAKASSKLLRKKVKKGLKQAFPTAAGPTPFEKAGESGKTPFEEAGKD